MEKITKICENNFDVLFLVKNNPKQIKKNRNEYKIFLADETKFSIQITNHNAMIIDANIMINKKEMGLFRIIPKETITLCKPVNHEKPFTYIQKMGNHLKNNIKELNFTITITFRPGVIYPKQKDLVVKQKSYRHKSQKEYIEYMNPYVYNDNDNDFVLCDDIDTSPIIDEELMNERSELQSPIQKVNEYNEYEALHYDGRLSKIQCNISCKKH
jgi:hypothetical protein